MTASACRGRPPLRRQQVLAVIEAAAVLGQTPTYRAIARDLEMDRTDVKRICRTLNWPSDFSPRPNDEKLM